MVKRKYSMIKQELFITIIAFFIILCLGYGNKNMKLTAGAT